MVVCEIECQLTKGKEKLAFMFGHMNIIILTVGGIIVFNA
jgi:hypothetical protein